MRQYAHLLLAIFVLSARAATIPDSAAPELEKKLPSVLPEESKPPTENASSEHELIHAESTVKDVENKLRNEVKAVEDIPVKVIVEEVVPSVKTGEEKEKNNEVVEDEEIVRPLVDLRNPGPPQRQEHETQNPEHYEEANRSATSVKENIQEAQVILRQGFQGVNDGFQSWTTNNEQVNKLQSSIDALNENFSNQIQKLNETLQHFIESKPVQSPADDTKTKAGIQNIELRLKTLQNNFNAGVKTLTEGVHVVASLRGEGEGTAEGQPPAGTTSTVAPTTASPFPNPINIFNNFMSNFQSSVSNGMSNVTQAINNFINQGWNGGNFIQGSTTVAPQPDKPADDSSPATTARPSPWQNIQNQFQNIFNPNQGQNPPTQSQAPSNGPLAVIQNLPIVQSIQNFINRPGAQPTEQPAQAAGAAPAASQTGTNQVPAASAQPAESKPESENKPEPEKKPEQPSGPIRQLLEKNPVVQSISSAVKRVQTSINNPEKPRETEKNETEQEKGGIVFVGGHRPGGNGAGDNNDSGSGLIPEAEAEKETVPDQKTEIKEDTPATEKKTE